MPDKLLTAAEVLDYMNIHKEALIALIRNENMPFLRIGKQVRFRPEDLEPWLETRRVSASTDPECPVLVESALGIAADSRERSTGGNAPRSQRNASAKALSSEATSISETKQQPEQPQKTTEKSVCEPMPITDPFLIYQQGNALALKIFASRAAQKQKHIISSIIGTLYPEEPVESLVASALASSGQPVIIGVLPPCLNSILNIIVTSDKQYAFYIINRDKIVTDITPRDELFEALAEMRIRHGINTGAIGNANHPDAPGKLMLVARGSLPKVMGKPELKVHFKTPRTFNPKDIESLGDEKDTTQNFPACHKDEVLAEVVSAGLSRNGIDVYGNIVTSDDADGPLLKSGPNTYFSSDRSRIHASCDGIPYWKGRAICVDNTLILDGVGYDTGNIQAGGRMVIQGNVQSGFSIDALRKIIIKGQVDAATVRSRKSSISVLQGIHGNDKAMLVAGSSIQAAFATGCTLEAGMNIIVDTSIVRCNVSAFKSIKLREEGSRVVSSTLSAGRCISVGSCGTKSQLRTTLKVQIPSDDRSGFEKERLEKQIIETRNKIRQQKSRIFRLREQKSSAVEPERRQLQRLEKRLSKQESALETFYQWLKDSDTIYIDVRETAWPGTVIGIEDKELRIRKPLYGQRFYYTHSGILHKDI